MNKGVYLLFRLEQNRGCLSELDSAMRLPYYSHAVSAVERLLEVLGKIFALYHSSRSSMGTKKRPPPEWGSLCSVAKCLLVTPRLSQLWSCLKRM